MNVLFICTHNRCRSIVAEAVAKHLIAQHPSSTVGFASAGSQPEGKVFPEALKQLEKANISTEGLHSKSWDAIDDFSADIVITVCDSAAGEACPLWLAPAMKVHWPLTDPSKLALQADATQESVDAGFEALINTLSDRINQLITLVETTDDADELQAKLQQLSDA